MPKLVERGNLPAVDRAVDGIAARRVGVLVLGMHRAGTSALTRMLNLLGCALPRTLLGGDQTNPEGHWESERICRFNDELLALAGSKWDDWLPIGAGFFRAPGYPNLVTRGAELLREEFGGSPLFVFKDPRNCRLAQFWLDVFAQEAIDPAVVIPIRNPLAVAQSLKTRNKADEHYGPLLWLRHVLDAEAASRGRSRVFTSYDQMIERWEVVAGRLQQGLAIDWPRLSPATQEEIDAFIDKGHRHEIASPEAIDDDPVVSGWLRRTWAILHRWSTQEENHEDYAQLDIIRRGFDEAAPAFARLILRGTQAQHRVDELERSLSELQTRADDIAIQAARQLHSEQEALVQELRDAQDSLAQYDSRTAEQESALIQRREENEQVWAALSQEQANGADLRSQIADLTKREASQQQRLAEADAWVFRLAGERSAAEQRLNKLAKEQAQLARAAAREAVSVAQSSGSQAQLKEQAEEIATLTQLLQQAAATDAIRLAQLSDSQAQLEELTDEVGALSRLLQQAAATEAVRLEQLSGGQARLQELTEEIVTLSRLLQQAELRATTAEAGNAHNRELKTKNAEMDARLRSLLSEQAETQSRLRDRFGELAVLTSLIRDKEKDAERQTRHGEWLRQIGAALATRPRWWALMPNAWQQRRDDRRFSKRGLFDAEAYLAEHPDVRRSGMNPLRHYLLHGYAEGRLPTSTMLLDQEAGQ